jgi:hypothetical protein
MSTTLLLLFAMGCLDGSQVGEAPASQPTIGTAPADATPQPVATPEPLDAVSMITVSGTLSVEGQYEGEIRVFVGASGAKSGPQYDIQLQQPGPFELPVPENMGEAVIGAMAGTPAAEEDGKPGLPPFLSPPLAIEIGAEPIEDITITLVPSGSFELVEM